MKCRLDLILKSHKWEGLIDLPAYFQATFTGQPQCYNCKGYFEGQEEAYLIDPSGKLVQIKSAVKHVYNIRKRTIILYNVSVWCTECFAEVSSIQQPPINHRVIIKVLEEATK